MLIVLGALAALAATPGAWRSVNSEAMAPKALITGETTAAFADALERGLAFRELAIAVDAAVTVTLFSEGRRGVLIGSDGWLFSSEEFDTPTTPATNLAVNADQIASLATALRTAGVFVVVALIPDKAAIAAERLGQWEIPPWPRARYHAAFTALASRDVPVVDLEATLRTVGARAFTKTDTHWSPLGARRAAAVVAAAVAARDLGPRRHIPLRLRAPRWHEGDLGRFLPLGAIGVAPPGEWLTPLTAELTVGPLDVVDTPVLLIGTSYSERTVFGFEAALRSALGVEVVNLAISGRGPIAPMRDVLAGDALDRYHPRLVIWEIPVRYLDDPDL